MEEKPTYWGLISHFRDDRVHVSDRLYSSLEEAEKTIEDMKANLGDLLDDVYIIVKEYHVQ